MTTIEEFLSHLRSLRVSLWVDRADLRCRAPEGVLTSELTGELRSRKNEIVSFLLGSQTTPGLGIPPIPRLPRDGRAFLASYAQRRLWFLDQLGITGSAYHIPIYLRLLGPLNGPALERSLTEIVRRHEVLRTTFQCVDGEPIQVILPPFQVALPSEDMRGTAVVDQEQQVRRLAVEDWTRRFNLGQDAPFRAALIQLGNNEHILLLTIHHIAGDGWSIDVLVRELSILYQAFVVERPSPLPELAIQYADFAAWQRQWFEGGRLAGQLAYWREQLRDLTPLPLATDRPRPSVETFRGAGQSFQISAEVTEQLQKLNHEHGVTMFMALLATFQVLLYRLTGEERIAVGSPMANRNRSEVEGLIGFFVNSLVICTDLSGEPTFVEVLKRVRKVALGAFAHQDLPFERLVEALQPDRDLSRNPLFQVAFALQQTEAMRPRFNLPELEVRLLEPDPISVRFDLELHLFEDANLIRGYWWYNADLFERQTMEQMLIHFQSLLAALMAHPEKKISQLPLLVESERHHLLIELNQTRRDYPRDRCLHDLFEAQAEKNPMQVAGIWEKQLLRYGTLNTRANQLANYLRRLGIGPGVLVAICMERTPELVVGLLGILKAGGAYVPLDPAYPSDRLAFVLDDTHAPVVLTLDRFSQRLPETSAKVVCLDGGWSRIADEDDTKPRCGVTADRVAYVIYTSGSTGRPKGVAVSHRAVSRLVLNTDYVSLGPADRVAQLSNIAFDAATFEIWGALLNGATLIGIGRDTVLSPPKFAAQIKSRGVTTLFLTTALFNEMARAVPKAFSGVTQVLFGGEAVDPRWVREVLEMGPPERLLHVYGPTECTTFSTWHAVKPGDLKAGTIPIGRPIANTLAYVLDRLGNPAPIGMPGELYLGGDGLANGYLNLPELTADRFISNPFVGPDQPGGSRLYRTGDLVRYRPDGNIEFLRRLDDQVKIRGFRVEPREIEAALAQHPTVAKAVVVAKEQGPADRHLVAYVVPKPGLDLAKAASHVGFQNDRISEWRTVFDQSVYHELTAPPDPTFNTRGWISSYTGQPIPDTEMAEWLDDTVGRIRKLAPQRILEIGCGTGMLLFRIAPDSVEYIATDFSRVALDYVRRQIKRLPGDWSNVKFLERTAHNFEGIEPESINGVILNSVAQYFPDIEYLLRVLEGALRVVEPGGVIFFGDVRSYPLLEMFHTSVQLWRAPDSLGLDELRRKVEVQVAQESELTIDPAFFLALPKRLPKVGWVEVVLKRGRAQNELTQFRYQAILHVGPMPRQKNWPLWTDWEQENLNLDKVAELLASRGPNPLSIGQIPNARLSHGLRTVNLLSVSSGLKTVGDLRQRLRHSSPTGVDLEDLYALGEKLGFNVDLNWARHGRSGTFDAVFRQKKASALELSAPDTSLSQAVTEQRSEQKFANRPCAGRKEQALAVELRSYLRRKLPDYMVPSAVELIDALPLTPNGKVDRRALRPPDRAPLDLPSDGSAVPNPLEQAVAKVWREVLGVNHVGVNDNFFELGGHSLLAVRLLTRLREHFGKDIPISVFLQSPTIQSLTDLLAGGAEGPGWSPVVPLQPLGKKPPFFCVTPGMGTAFPYCELARKMGPDQPFFALQPRGLVRTQPPIYKIEALAEYYVEAIRTVQRKGPYHVGGWSFGAPVAYEMARCLEARGESASLTVLIDAPARVPSQKLPLSRLIRFFCGTVLLNLYPYVEQFYRIATSPSKSDQFPGSGASQRGFWAKQTVFLSASIPLLRVFAANVIALARYKPESYKGGVTLLRTESGILKQSSDPTWGWSQLAQGGADVRVVPGNHMTLLQTPQVEFVARTLLGCLEGFANRPGRLAPTHRSGHSADEPEFRQDRLASASSRAKAENGLLADPSHP